MAKYVDGFVLVVPNDKVKEYINIAEEGRDMWMKHGALQYFECKGEDLVPKEMGDMTQLSFTELAKTNNEETVWFSFIVFHSREHRDEVNKKVMEEMGEKYKDIKDMVMPFDTKRMAYGGFDVQVEG